MEENGAKLSLCMIAKDASDSIRRCLSSVRGAVDEMVVLDTGSTDDTASIAERAGARVFRHAWKDDFSEARNAALNRVSTPWVLVLDADEELEQADIPVLRSFLGREDAAAVHAEVVNFHGRGRTRLLSPRLFRKGKARYEGSVHNRLVIEGKSVYSPVRIYHYGYHLDPEAFVRKQERTKTLLLRGLEERPDDTAAWTNLIHVLRNTGHFLEAWQKGGMLLERMKEDLEVCFISLSRDLADCGIRLGYFREAAKICRNALRWDPDNVDILFSLGLAFLKNGKPADAAALLQKMSVLLEGGCYSAIPEICVESLDYDFLVSALIGDCMEALGNPEEAKRWSKKALLEFERKSGLYGYEAPGDMMLILGNAAFRAGDDERAVSCYQSCLKQRRDQPEVLNNLACSFSRRGFAGEAVKLFHELSDKHPGYAPARRNSLLLLKQLEREDTAGREKELGLLHFLNGDLIGARECFMKSIRLNGPDEDSLFHLARIAAALNDRSAMEEALDCMEEMEVSHSRMKAVGDLCANAGACQRAIGYYTGYLEKSPQDVSALVNLSSCYARLGFRESAVIGLETALALDPSCTAASRNLDLLKRMENR